MGLLANVASSGAFIKQELLPQDGDDDVVVIGDRPAAPYYLNAHGGGYHVYIPDTKNLAQDDINVLLSILGPPKTDPPADARARMRFDRLATGGQRIDVPDTGLLTVAQLASLRRVISGTTDYVVGGQHQNPMNVPIPIKSRSNSTDVRSGGATTIKRGRPPK
ncbi:hypothetical protein AAVH_39382, partial [Aphelenchoides avenae]